MFVIPWLWIQWQERLLCQTGFSGMSCRFQPHKDNQRARRPMLQRKARKRASCLKHRERGHHLGNRGDSTQSVGDPNEVSSTGDVDSSGRTWMARIAWTHSCASSTACRGTCSGMKMMLCTTSADAWKELLVRCCGTLDRAQQRPTSSSGLQTRFGTALQAEWFKAELRAQRYRENKTLQDLYRDISRLVSLAYPSTDVTLTNRVGKEAFINALNNGPLQLEVMK